MFKRLKNIWELGKYRIESPIQKSIPERGYPVLVPDTKPVGKAKIVRTDVEDLFPNEDDYGQTS